MDRWKFFDVIHEDHVFWNPMSEAKVGEMIALLRLPPGARVLDIACGAGEFLVRTLERWGASGVGVELSPWTAKRARERFGQSGLGPHVELLELDGAKYEAAPESFDLTVCMGASWIWQGHAGTLDALARWTKPGGLVLVGEPFWREEPSPEYLQAIDLPAEAFGTHQSNVEAGYQQGLRFLYSIVSGEDDWDRYEGLHAYAAERYARAHPEDPDGVEIAKRVEKDFDAYLRWGRQQLGWALYLFLKP